MAALTLTEETYRDKVLGAWVGKSIGVTLGVPMRGQMTPGRNNFYSPIPGQPSPGIGLDFPLVWLAVLEEIGPDIAPEDMAVAWLEHLDYAQDEFGYASLNLRRGLPPPASGTHSNWFRHSTGGVMRADFWGLLMPGAPQAAAAAAYQDSTQDHAEDGEWAAMFLAAMISAAFFISDPRMLITIGLSVIPRTCRTARAVKTALEAAFQAAAWLEAREKVQHAVGRPNFTDAPQNMGFLAIGLLYGMNDFGATLCAAANCGYDSEAVGGAIGALLGVLRGRSGLPEDWTRPIGDVYIPGGGLRDIDPPMTLSELATRTVAVGKTMVAFRCRDVSILGEGEALPMPVFLPESEADTPNAPQTASETPSASASEPIYALEDLPPLPTASLASAAPPEPAAPMLPDELLPSAENGLSTDGMSAIDTMPPLFPIEAQKPVESASAATPFAVPTFPMMEAPVPAASEESSPILSAQPPSLEPIPDEEATQPAGFLRPQPVTATELPVISQGLTSPDAVIPTQTSLAPDYTTAINWVDNTQVKPLLVTPPNAMFGQAGPFQVVMDSGEAPTIAYNIPKTLSFSIYNRSGEPFSGRIAMLAPSGWQINAPTIFGQRQYIAANTGSLRADFTVRVLEGQGRVDIANAITLRFTPESGGDYHEAEFLLMGAACWWCVGPFANFDGEGFDRSYLPEDRPGLHESYYNRLQQNVRWENWAFPEATLNLESLFKSSSGVCYGQTILRSPTAREARLVASTNNGVKVWLNGTLVLRRYHRETFRPTLGSGPWAVDVALKQGDNPVMVKWVRGVDPYQFSLTVSDRFGRGIPEIGNTSW